MRFVGRQSFIGRHGCVLAAGFWPCALRSRLRAGFLRAPLRRIRQRASSRRAAPADIRAYFSRPARGRNIARRHSRSGPARAFCVRTCDGLYFPVQAHGGLSAARSLPVLLSGERNASFLPAAISTPPARQRRQPLRRPDNAFAYRKALVAGCTCNGRDAFGLAHVDPLRSDPAAGRRGRHPKRPGRLHRRQTTAADFTPVRRLFALPKSYARIWPADAPRAADARRARRTLMPGGAAAATTIARLSWRVSRHFLASDSELVSPGDSMPNICTSPGRPCCAGASIRKSACGSPWPGQLRADAGIIRRHRAVRHARPIAADARIEQLPHARDRRRNPRARSIPRPGPKRMRPARSSVTCTPRPPGIGAG